MGLNWSPEARVRHLDELEAAGLFDSVATATRHVWHRGRRPTDIVIRRETVARQQPDDDMPPVPRLVSAKSHALKLYLTAIFEAQCTHPANALARNARPIMPASKDEVGWINLFAAPASADGDTDKTPTDNRVRQFKNALRRLDKEGLVELPKNPGSRDRFDKFQLVQERGRSGFADQPRYVIPHPSDGFNVPRLFFTYLWHHVLTDSEILVYLALAHLRRIYPEEYEASGVYLTPAVRSSIYGISRDAYEAHRALAAFGLIRRQSHSGRHANGRIKNFKPGKIVDPFRFKVVDGSLDRPALRVVRRRVNLVGSV
jgi:hypothetical protein